MDFAVMVGPIACWLGLCLVMQLLTGKAIYATR